jgi:transposase
MTRFPRLDAWRERRKRRRQSFDPPAAQLELTRCDGHPRSGVQPRKKSTMERVAGRKPRRRRSFTPEFKAEVVGLVRQPGNTVGSVARDLDLTETAVREWVKQAERDEGARADGLTTVEGAEMAQLRNRFRVALPTPRLGGLLSGTLRPRRRSCSGIRQGDGHTGDASSAPSASRLCSMKSTAELEQHELDHGRPRSLSVLS